jgi:hypothetical protein
MNLRSIQFVLAFTCVLASGASAQGQDYMAMMQAMEKAKADAAQPGDETLTCGQLEQQLLVVVQDPAFQAHIESAGAEAKKQQEAMEVAKGLVAVQTLRTALMTFVPGAAMAGMTQMQAQATAQGMRGMAQMKERMARTQQMMTLMPQLMRGQRVVELAVAKNCEWAAGAGMQQP